MSKKPNGAILFEGNSSLDGKPIVVIATGLAKASANSKTGAMVQTYILRADLAPLEALKTGADASICGDCPHRGDGSGKRRSCYVNIGRGITSVWDGYKRGIYPAADSHTWEQLRGKVIRFGTYGDPAAAPLWLWQLLGSLAKRHTGYTHQWRKLGSDWASLLMASADSERDYAEAKEQGWRTFRVRTPEQPLFDWEIACPASEEAGRKTQCVDCTLCAGTSAKARNIAIQVHGVGKRSFAA